MTTTWFIVARAVHIGACLLFFGGFAFDRWVASPVFAGEKAEAGGWWQNRQRILNLILLPVILLSGIFWYMLVAMTMSGQPPQLEVLETVWTRTQFGTVSGWRLIFWLAATLGVGLLLVRRWPPTFQNCLLWFQLLVSGALLGSLAWAGHGQESSVWHLLADVLHLLVAGFWPAGLLPFFWLLCRLRQAEPVRWDLIAILIRRFSAVSLGSVALLVITGFINSLFLVGSFSNLFQQSYGRWLLLKIILFGLAVGLGAVNLLRLKPALSREETPESVAVAARLEFNVQVEFWLGVAIIVTVAVLGILPPANR
jgi:copper resistance protein D